MNMMTINRPLAGEPFLPRTTQRTRSRLGNFLLASGLTLSSPKELDERLAAGFAVEHNAGTVVTATSSNRPFFYPECEQLVELLKMDLVLLRFDPLHGTSFDILQKGSGDWHCRYYAWRRSCKNFWLVPETTFGPFFQTGESGLKAFDAPPFESGNERYAGIIRAIETPSFAGRF